MPRESTNQNDIALFDEGAFFEEMLTDIERRGELEHAGRVAADIILDADQKGPLTLYVQSRRVEAAEALRALVDTDPRDALTIAQHQHAVAEYTRALQWIRGRLEDAETAAAIIKEDYNGTQDDAD